MVFGQRCDTARRRHKPLPIPGGMPCYWFRVWTTGFSNLRRDGSPRRSRWVPWHCARSGGGDRP